MNKGKKGTICIFVLLMMYSSWILSAEAPELRNVMPNSWQKVERVRGEEEQRVIAENDSDIREIIGKIRPMDNVDKKLDNTDVDNLHIKVYKQQIGSDVFYRFFVTDREAGNYGEWLQQHMQVVVLQRRESRIILASGLYCGIVFHQYGTDIKYTSIDIIESGGTAKALLISEVSVRGIDDGDDLQSWFLTGYRNSQNGQPAGKVNCVYFTLEDCMNYYSASGDRRMTYHKLPYITIEGSDCLVDVNSPLRYGLQSAFDGNPATSYVENTEDDLMWIDIMGAWHYLEKIALINGYAQNEYLYRSNNRIKKIKTEYYEFLPEGKYSDVLQSTQMDVDDMNMSYQVFDFSSNLKIFITDIYKGEKYNDTCLAELKIKPQGYEWLFGGIDE